MTAQQLKLWESLKKVYRMILPRNIDDWPDLYKELFEERAGIQEFCANKPKIVAEFMAEDEIRRLAEQEDRFNWGELT